MALPFEVPADLKALSAEEFATYLSTVVAHGSTLHADESAAAEDLTGTRDALLAARAESDRRAAELAAAKAARAELASFTAPEPTPAPEPEPTPVPEVAPVAPVQTSAVVVASTIDTPPTPEKRIFATLTASMDTAQAGQEIADFAAAGVLIEKRLSTYGSSVRTAGAPRLLGGRKFALEGRALNRHGVVTFNRQLDDALRVTDINKAMDVLEHARNQKRLFGGTLLDSMANAVNKGVALTAAAGWCAPSETIYDLCALETIDGILDLPTVQATRGGFQIPENGGVDFSVIWDGIGDDGDPILSEYDVENGVDKVCVEIPCPDFVEVRLDVAYVCITGALLQRRGYPEAVTRFSEGAMVALAHKVNQSVIARMVTQSGAATVIPEVASSTDAASQVLHAAELAAIDMRYRHRMSSTAVLEMVFPIWALGPIRSAIARRAGVAELAVTDAEILSWFRVRNVAPRFVYDWQDALTGLSGGPGTSAALTTYPANVSFLVYPAGTWVKAERDVVNLDTVYDNALLTQNQYTALFAEDGFNVLKMCADSRLYTTALNAAGVTGCCP